MADDVRRLDRAGSPPLVMSEGPWGESGASGAGASPSSDERDPDREEERNPWMRPPRKRPRLPRGDKAGAPSIEELFRRGRARLGGGLPQGGRPIWGYALAAFVLLWLATTSIHRIDSQERGVVTRFGRYVETLQPGLAVTLPAPIDTVTRVDVDQVRTLDMPRSGGENLLLTGDHNLVDMAYSVRWSVRDPELYLFALDKPEETVRAVAESAMRAAVARVSLDQAGDGLRNAIETQVAARMQALLDRYRAGITIEGVSIRKADAPQAVEAAAKDVATARKQAQTYVDNAQSYADQVEADAQASADAFNKVYRAYKLAPEVTRTRIYDETMEAVLSKTNKVIVDAPGSSPRISIQMPDANDQASGDATAAAAATAPAEGNSQ